VALPRDPGLPRCVRDVVLDHAVDEGRHHAFFAAVLERLWPCLDRRQAVRVGVRIPQMIDAFLRPDAAALHSELRDLPLREEQRREVVQYAVERTDRVGAAVPTVRHFEKVGALDPPQVREAFAAAGLLASAPDP
jgi:P-aminobenzoate N-oxygenase AurF